MKVALSIHPARTLVLFAALAGVAWQVQADIGTECRQEAELYGIPPEQFQDYLDGCILSRGGYPVADIPVSAPGQGDAVMEGEAVPENVEPTGIEPAQETGYGAQ